MSVAKMVVLLSSVLCCSAAGVPTTLYVAGYQTTIYKTPIAPAPILQLLPATQVIAQGPTIIEQMPVMQPPPTVIQEPAPIFTVEPPAPPQQRELNPPEQNGPPSESLSIPSDTVEVENPELHGRSSGLFNQHSAPPSAYPVYASS